MTRKTAIYVVFLIVYSCLSIGCFNLKTTKHKINSEEIYDLGDIMVGSDPVIRYISFRNNGDCGLNIDFDKSSCGCISIADYEDQIQEGDEGIIGIKVFPQLGKEGLNEQDLIFNTNLSELPQIKIRVVYTLVPQEVFFSDSKIDFTIKKTDLHSQRPFLIGSIYIRDKSKEKLVVERLTTEWEWQAVADYDNSYTYGCGTTRNYTKANYESINPLLLSGPPYTAPVGIYPAYGYGLCDMTGNVWEWTSSCPSEDCDPYSDRCIYRGGGWIDNSNERHVWSNNINSP